MYLEEDAVERVIDAIQRSTRRNRKRAKSYTLDSQITDPALIQFIRTHGIKTVRQLRATQKLETPVPSYTLYRKRFGPWKRVMELAYSIPAKPTPPCPHPSPIEFLKLLVDNGINTWRHYLLARRRIPSLFPTDNYVRKVLFPNLKWSEISSVKDNVRHSTQCGAYIKLWERLGSQPTSQDCEKNGLDYRLLRSRFSSVGDMRKFFTSVVQYKQRLLKKANMKDEK